MDIPSKMFRRILDTKPEIYVTTFLDKLLANKTFSVIKDEKLRKLAELICSEFDKKLVKTINTE